jgi:hypothetical protein
VVADASAYEVILGIVIGSLLGFSSRKIMKLAEYVSLAVLSIGELHVRAGS